MDISTIEVLTSIPFELDPSALLARLRVPEGSDMAGEILALAEAIAPAAAPKAVYKECFIEGWGDDTVTLEGVTFTSRVLRANLDSVQRVFAYVATCGTEIDALGMGQEDFLSRYWVDTIKELALEASSRFLRNHLKKKYLLGRMASMNPGAGDVNTWPIEQQQLLFSLFGNVEELIGVRLTETHLMIPNKSVSGLFFPTEVPFESCMVCQRPNCPGRKAPYNPDFLATRASHGELSES